jgi:hypothetical protein
LGEGVILRLRIHRRLPATIIGTLLLDLLTNRHDTTLNLFNTSPCGLSERLNIAVKPRDPSPDMKISETHRI